MKKFLSKLNSFTEKFSGFVVKARWIFIAVFVVLTAVSCYMITQNKVVYDLSGYLPADSDATKALNVLKEEFDDKGMAYVMVSGVSEKEALDIRNELASIEGVATVTYVEEMNYKNGNALYTVTLSDYDSTPVAFQAMEDIMSALEDEEAYYTGQSAYSYYTRLETEESILKIGVVIVIIILIMLVFTSKTYFELVIMLICFGVAVALNMGTNFLFNGISYISNLVSLVLQLALSIDYSVIMLHRYMEERKLVSSPESAMVVAETKGIKEICSSSLTTIAGLVSLVLMTLPIGVEIGLSLAKSIVMSLVSVIFLMPALLILFDKILMKSAHKSFVPNITKPAFAILKARKVIVTIFLVVTILSGVGQFFNTYSFNYNGSPRILKAQQAMKEDFGTLNSFVVIVPKGNPEQERALAEYVMDYEIIDSVNALSTIEIAEGVYLTDEFTKDGLVTAFSGLLSSSGMDIPSDILETFATSTFNGYCESKGITATTETKVRLVDLLEYVASDDTISALLGDFAPLMEQLVFAKSNLESANYSRLTFNINAPIESKEAFEFFDKVKVDFANYYDEYYMMGESFACYEMSLSFGRDNLLVCLCTIIFVLAILLFTFRNFSIPVVLVLAIQGGVWINFVIPFLQQSPICFIGYLIISAVQMGATIDYAIVLANRYETTKNNFDNRFEAMATAQNATFPTVITSGIILIVTGIALGIMSSGVVSELGTLLGIGAATSVAIVLFVLPSLLVLTDKLNDKMYFNKIFKKKPVIQEEPIEQEDAE